MRVSDTDYFAHHGVKGMKWGVRKEPERTGRKLGKTEAKVLRSNTAQSLGKRINKVNADRARAKKLRKAQKAYDKNVQKNWVKAYNNAANYANRVLIPEINKQYTPDMLKNPKTRRTYEAEYQRRFNEVYQMEFDKMFGKRPGSR